MIRIAGWLVPVVVLAGCTAPAVPVPEPVVSATTQAACVVGSVTVGEPANPEQQFTQVISSTSGPGTVQVVELVNVTFTPTLTWQTSPPPDDDEVMVAIGEQTTEEPIDPPTDSPGDNTETLTGMLSSVDSDDGVTTIGYTSIVVSDHPVSVACDGDGTAQGTLATWSDLEVGIVACDHEPAQTEPRTPARAAWDEYCAEE